jgi:hypothetical protein
MPPKIVAYEDFLAWCEKEKNWLTKRALQIARNTDQNNRTGHIMRGYLAAGPFLRQYPAVAKSIREVPIDGEGSEFLDTSDDKFQKAWKEFLKKNRLQHAILRKILPTSLGGQTTSGGGAAYPFKVALRLTAEMLSPGGTAATVVSPENPKYRMVRRKEFDRDYDQLNDLKKKYDYACQICGMSVRLGKGRYFCEAHHLRPLGGIHQGKDTEGNVIIVCPNHHAEFDFFLFAILDIASGKGKLEHMYRDLATTERSITVKHKLDKENLDYIVEQFLTRMDLYFSGKDAA